jgi:hypothetical protein
VLPLVFRLSYLYSFDPRMKKFLHDGLVWKMILTFLDFYAVQVLWKWWTYEGRVGFEADLVEVVCMQAGIMKI